MSSPLKKKMKIISSPESNNKRNNESSGGTPKRLKQEKKSLEEDLQAKKRKNFVTACEIVSYKAYFDLKSRFQLIYLPTCARNSACTHHTQNNITYVKQIPSYAEESFKIEMKSNVWCEALEVCILCITPDQYLSANVLKNVVEIMLNAHDDKYADFTIDHLISKCQETLELHFSYHPPCIIKGLRNCYNDFLFTPMDLKENTFSDRSKYGCDKGIVKYCMNRLEYEISQESKDGPLVQKYENTPEEMKQSVKGLHWQKEKFEIYEVLERTERIDRLMAVLQSIVELLQFDLAIWNYRYTNNLGSHIMRSHKPLMASLLWSNNVLYTGAVNNNCRQILKLFVHLIHLEYPDEYLKIISLWLNTMVQTFYICENNSNSNYPNVGKYCMAFAKEFYKIICGMPQNSVIKILERIKPDYMQYVIGTLHLNTILSIQEGNPIRIFIEFINKSQWRNFAEVKGDIKIFKKKERAFKNVKDFFKFINKKCDELKSNLQSEVIEDVQPYKKLENDDLTDNCSNLLLNDIVHILFITLEAYLDAYSFQNMQETLDSLNEQLTDQNSTITDWHNLHKKEFYSYSVTEDFVKLYRSIVQSLRELMLLLEKMKEDQMLPETFKVFEKIGLFGM